MVDNRNAESLNKIVEWEEFEKSTTFIRVRDLIEYAVEGKPEQEIMLLLKERVRGYTDLMDRSGDKLAPIVMHFDELILNRSNDFHKTMEECHGLSDEDTVLLSTYCRDFISRHIHREMRFRRDIEKTEILVHNDTHIEIITPVFGSLPFSVDYTVILGTYRIIKEWVRLGRPENNVFQYYPLLFSEAGEVENPKELLKTLEKWIPEHREGENHVGLYYCSSNECFFAKVYVRADSIFANRINGGVGLLFSLNLMVTGNHRSYFEDGLFKGIVDMGFLLDSRGRPFSLDPASSTKPGYRGYPKGLTVKRSDTCNEITLDVAASEVLSNGRELFSTEGVPVEHVKEDGLYFIGVAKMDKSYPGSEGRILIDAEVFDFLPQYDCYKSEVCRDNTGRLFIKVNEGYNRKE